MAVSMRQLFFYVMARPDVFKDRGANIISRANELAKAGGGRISGDLLPDLIGVDETIYLFDKWCEFEALRLDPPLNDYDEQLVSEYAEVFLDWTQTNTRPSVRDFIVDLPHHAARRAFLNLLTPKLTASAAT